MDNSNGGRGRENKVKGKEENGEDKGIKEIH